MSTKIFRRGWIADLSIGFILFVIGVLLAFCGCESKRTCTCAECGCKTVCGQRCQDKPTEIRSQDIPPTQRELPPEPDKLIGSTVEETKSKTP